MRDKQVKRVLAEGLHPRILLPMVSTVLIVVILASLYLYFAWSRYQQMAKLEATNLAQSVGSLLHVEHIAELASSNQATAPDGCLVEESLTHLVEVTDSIYYAYILKQQSGSISVIADSSAANSDTSHPTRRSCEETADINQISFGTGQSYITDPISLPCGNWIRALVPIYDANGKSVIAVLGLSYSALEWQAKLWKKMIPDIMVVACLAALVFTLFNLLRKNARFKEAEASRQESERSKAVFFSHIPGMAYRCQDNENWTMEFVSEGCYDLTGYKAESFTTDKMLSFNGLISPEYRDLVRAEWKRVLIQRKRYRDEYEILTKSGERKWVLELGQGVYDDDGKLEALEGVVLDISDQKNKDAQIAHLREHDFLTGLYNRNYIEQQKKYLDQPEFWPLSIAICDIDGLRMINDAYGHEEGDRLIIKTAHLIQGCLRNESVLGHAGGGEYILLLPHTDSQAAHQLKEEIKHAVESYNRASEKALYASSISIGHATKETEHQTMQDVTRAAEEYLSRRKLLNQNSSHSAIVSSIMATLYAKSQETEQHGQRLGLLCHAIGEQLGLSQKELDELQLLSKLHDIGKIGIDDRILNKTGKLTESEWVIMRQHPEIGHRIAMSTPQLEHIADYILYHHERWDGTGYPIGLKEREIPVISRILAIADAYDAMTEDRIYRKALPKDMAIKEIERNMGTQFDPDIAQLFFNIIDVPYHVETITG